MRRSVRAGCARWGQAHSQRKFTFGLDPRHDRRRVADAGVVVLESRQVDALLERELYVQVMQSRARVGDMLNQAAQEKTSRSRQQLDKHSPPRMVEDPIRSPRQIHSGRAC